MKLIRLGSGHDSSSLADALRPVIDGALALVCDELFDQDTPEHRQVRTNLQGHRQAFAEATTGDQIASTAGTCLLALETALKEARAQRIERSDELATLVMLVRDAVAVLTGEQNTFSAGLGQTADRFDALLTIPDVQRLREALSKEVGDLRRLVLERQQQWQATAAMLESRVETLETQLVTVREEATLDLLTGIDNRRRFETALEALLGSSTRQFVLAVFDLDGFKRINDTLGHQVAIACFRQWRNRFRAQSGAPMWWRALAATSSRC